MTQELTLKIDIADERKNIEYLQEKLEKSAAYRRVVEAQETLSSLRKLCTCPKQYCTIEYGGDTGNYDPTCDYYSKTVTCTICGKRACYHDHEEMYNNY